jgi:hypothetical protein
MRGLARPGPYPVRMTFRNPAGPQPSSVYWRRRIVVLLGLIALIAIVVLIVVRPGAEAAPAAPATPTPTSSTLPQSPSPSPSATNAAGKKAVAACRPGQVEVTAVTDKETYGEDELPQLSMSISNVGDAPCSVNVGTSQMVFTVTSGSDTIWTSTDCQSDATDVPYTLPPASSGVAAATVTGIPWQRERSSPDTCDSEDRPAVPAGGASYHLDVSLGGFDSTESALFILN